ncbi:MAG: tetratricopeptide repeat protein [Desulfovibrio sp.]|nr:tetratricopeptide repeat protein [Desulfovibrio sp.]
MGIGIGSLLPSLLKDTSQIVLTVPHKQTPSPNSTKPQPSQSKEELQNIAALEKACAENPKHAELWVKLGNSYFDANLYQDAIAAYKNACSLGADTANVLTDLGIMYRKTKLFHQAIAMFKKAQEKDPKHVESRINEAIVLYFDLNQKEEALQVLQNLQNQHPAAVLPDGKTLQQFMNELR